jgi:hypothetical protein
VWRSQLGDNGSVNRLSPLAVHGFLTNGSFRSRTQDRNGCPDLLWAKVFCDVPSLNDRPPCDAPRGEPEPPSGHLRFADQPVIAHAVFPELPQPRAVRRLSNAARIVEFRHSSMQQLQDPFPVLRVELAEFGRASRMYFSTHAAARSSMGTKRSFLPLPLAHQQRAALAFQIEQSQPEFLKISQVPRPRFSRGSLRVRTAGIVPP